MTTSKNGRSGFGRGEISDFWMPNFLHHSVFRPAVQAFKVHVTTSLLQVWELFWSLWVGSRGAWQPRTPHPAAPCSVWAAATTRNTPAAFWRGHRSGEEGRTGIPGRDTTREGRDEPNIHMQVCIALGFFQKKSKTLSIPIFSFSLSSHDVLWFPLPATASVLSS